MPRTRRDTTKTTRQSQKPPAPPPRKDRPAPPPRKDRPRRNNERPAERAARLANLRQSLMMGEASHQTCPYYPSVSLLYAAELWNLPLLNLHVCETFVFSNQSLPKELYDDGTLDDEWGNDVVGKEESSDSTTPIPRTLMFIVFLGCLLTNIHFERDASCKSHAQ